ncbi:retropepsin-like aspartic protease family protein [Trichlorobacter ammonificans]|uniref:DUF4124 domain-containing protein n=1 Tax=Trichlorobacter ammonificans TaxID=2916410 RepID=A0ABM9DA61_9BACT|nr:retropepsin-like aspartic protease [Trichlorobacter ammonificans]CAH2032095.1 protein of unknown function [Trichlorobacter ammonificans]
MRRSEDEGSAIANAALMVVLIVSLGAILYFVDIKRLIFTDEELDRLRRQVQQTSDNINKIESTSDNTRGIQKEIKGETGEALEYRKPQTIIKQPSTIDNIAQYRGEKGKLYQYIDKRGVVSFTDNPESIPRDAKSVEERGEGNKNKKAVTKVVIDNDHVYVPVKIRNGGVIHELWMLMDTGATGVTVHYDVARQMNLQGIGRSYAVVADGRTVANLRSVVEELSVGPAAVHNFEISVMPTVMPQKHHGLLGMRFLKNFNYTVDLSRKEIRWN